MFYKYGKYDKYAKFETYIGYLRYKTVANHFLENLKFMNDSKTNVRDNVK